VVIRVGDRMDFTTMKKVTDIFNKKENFNFNCTIQVAQRKFAPDLLADNNEGDKISHFPLSQVAKESIQHYIDNAVDENNYYFAVIFRERSYSIDYFRDPQISFSYVDGAGANQIGIGTILKNIRIPVKDGVVLKNIAGYSTDGVEEDVSKDLDVEILVFTIDFNTIPALDGLKHCVVQLQPDNSGTQIWDITKSFSDITTYRSNLYLAETIEILKDLSRFNPSSAEELNSSVERLRFCTSGGVFLKLGTPQTLIKEARSYWLRARVKTAGDDYLLSEDGSIYLLETSGVNKNYWEYGGWAFINIRNIAKNFLYYYDSNVNSSTKLWDEEYTSSFYAYRPSDEKVFKLFFYGDSTLSASNRRTPLDYRKTQINQDFLNKLLELSQTYYYKDRDFRDNASRKKEQCFITLYSKEYGTGTGYFNYKSTVKRTSVDFSGLSQIDKDFFAKYFNFNNFNFYLTFRDVI